MQSFIQNFTPFSKSMPNNIKINIVYKLNVFNCVNAQPRINSLSILKIIQV